MTWYIVLLDYVKALVTWPVAAVVIVLILRRPIVRLIERVVSVRVPGVQLDTRQQPESPAPKPVPETPAPSLPAHIQLTPEQQEQLNKVFQAERAAARLWEYRYLNLFLAPITQLVLNWFMTVQLTTGDAFDAFWSQYITDVDQRITILKVLTGHYLVEAQGPVLRVSDKGKEYVGWRGALPPPAAGAPAVSNAPAATAGSGGA